MSMESGWSHLLDPTRDFYSWKILSNIYPPFRNFNYENVEIVQKSGFHCQCHWRVISEVFAHQSLVFSPEFNLTGLELLHEVLFRWTAPHSNTYSNANSSQVTTLFLWRLSLVVFSGSPTHFQHRSYLPRTSTHIFQLLAPYNTRFHICQVPAALSVLHGTCKGRALASWACDVRRIRNNI